MAHHETPGQGNVYPGFYFQPVDGSSQMVVEDFDPLVTTRDGRTQTSKDDFDFNPQIFSKETPFGTSGTSEQNSRTELSSNQMIAHGNQAHKRPSHKIYGMSDQVFSTFSAQCDLNYDSQMGINETSLIPLDNSCVSGFSPESQYIDESHSQNQKIQMLDASGNEKLLTMSQNAIDRFTMGQNTIDPPTNCQTTIRPLTMNLNTFDHLTMAKNTASSMNIFQNGSPAGMSPYGGESKEKNVLLFDNILAVSGPSCSYENVYQSYSSLEKFPISYLSNPQIAVGTEERRSVCLGCKKERASHANIHEGENSHKYCQCEDTNNIYEVGSTQDSSHENEYKCNRCPEKYQSETELQDHYYIHEEYHERFCRVCRREIHEHFCEKEYIFKCCKCLLKLRYKSHLLKHLYTHSDLRLFKCNFCKCRFKTVHRRNEHCKNVHGK